VIVTKRNWTEPVVVFWRFGIRRAIAGPFNPAIIPAMYFSRLVTGVKRWFGA
jgi:hypothetical protein